MNQQLYITAIRVPADSEFAEYARWDYYQLHRLVCMGFKDREAAKAARILYRFDLEGEAGFLYIQSLQKPDWSRLPRKLDIRGPVPLKLPEMKQGDELRFRLLAKPSWRVGKKKYAQYGRRLTLRTERAQRAWLERKANQSGFRVTACVITERVWNDTKTNERLPNGSPKPLYGVQFDGRLLVTDPPKLVEAVANGIGPQKAYGFGLLSVAPIG